MRLLDQNQLSNVQLIQGGEAPLVIADMAFFENLKKEAWREDLTHSFAAFHQNPERLHLAYSVPELLQQELQSGVPTADVINHAGTDQLRTLLSQADYIPAIEANVAALRAQPLAPVAALSDNRRDLQGGMNALAKIAGPAWMSQLKKMRRNKSATLVDFAESIAGITAKTLPSLLTELGVQNVQESPLNKPASALYRFQFCYWAQVFKYSMSSPNLQAGDEKLLNDIVDSDYAVTASFCDSLETADEGLQERYETLLRAIKINSQE